MKKLFLFLSVCFGVSQSFQAQELKMCGYQGYQTVEEVTSACDLQGATASINDTSEATVVVDNILDKVGLFRNFLIEECDNINNALAVTMPLEGGDIDRYILYDEAFFTKVSASTGTDWGLTSILAHEVGHHLNGHTLKGGGSNHKVELQADEFSGFVLARMGCSLSDAQSAVSNLLPDEASATHPAKQDRLNAIEVGWNRGNGKTIVVKKIEENEKPNEITAEQVIANYLDAIGGQEKIMEIKTLFKNETMTMKMKASGIKMDTKTNRELLYASPINQYTKIKVSGTNIYVLILNNKFYQKDKPQSSWVLKPGTNVSYNEGKGVSYIPEFGVLTNNLSMEYLGVKNIDKKDCYVIDFPELELKRDESGIMNYKSTKYYEVSTGLLYYEETVLESTSSANNYGNSIVKSKTIYSDYRPVNGVLFSFKQDMTMLITIAGNETPSTTITEYSEIKVNPTIDPAIFDVNR
ncbi:MAG: hypothetical protein JJE55_11575 [Flavobacteriaceae bacterium]|nr:hypothetical protein [Flavobacteriaceae bacterium]